MRRRPRDDFEEASPTTFTVDHDVINEQVVIVAALVDPQARERLLRSIRPDHFIEERHQVIWHAFGQLQRQGLALDLSALQRAAGDRVDVTMLEQLLKTVPYAAENVAWHTESLFWDKQRVAAARGPVAALLDALTNQQESPERVRALAHHVGTAFDGGFVARAHLHDGGLLVSTQVDEVRRRIEGHACYPFGIPGLDFFDPVLLADGQFGGKRRMIPGLAPGQVTIITGVPGSGKSTFTARLVLAQVGLRRRVCYGAWEMTGGMTLELLACMSLGWSRTSMLDPAGSQGEFGREHLVRLEEEMHKIVQWVTFFKNPFHRRGEGRASNEKNLDVVQGVLSDSACDVFIADLWKRCLAETSPDDEEDALTRQQEMAKELQQHHVLVQQQRFKDIEARPDKRPTREGIKGSGAYVEVSDNIVAMHRPGQWKDIEDNKVEAIIYKQRYGRWPLAVEFDWNAEYGLIENGRDVKFEYAPPAASNVTEAFGPTDRRKHGA